MKASNELTIIPSSNEMLTTNNTALINSTGLVEEDLNRKKFNDLWSFYLFMFNLILVSSSILLQFLVGILLLMNTKSTKNQPNFPRRSGECYNHIILVVILFITIINIFIVIFVDETT